MNTNDFKDVSRLTAKKLKRARAFINQGKTIAGIRLCEEIIKFDPGSGFVWLLYADALTDTFRFHEALSAYEHALDYSPENYKCFVNAKIGILFENSRGVVEAGKYFKLASENSNEPVAWIQILFGNNLMKQGLYDEAEKVFMEAASLKSEERAEAYLNLALLYRATERYDNSREMAIKALKIDPKYLPAKQLIESLEFVE